MKSTIYENSSLIISKGTPPENWDSFVSTLGGGFYLTNAYAEINKQQGAIPIYFRLIDGNNTTGVALGFIRSRWARWPANELFKIFDWQTHPAVINNDQKTLTFFSKKIIEKIEKYSFIKFHLHSEDAIISPDFHQTENYINRDRLEYRVELSDDPIDVMARISSRKRTYLRSAIKETTIVVRELSDQKAVEQLIQFQEISRERRRMRGEDYAIASQSAAKSIYESYVANGFGRVFISYQNETPLSGILLHCWNKRAYYTMSGCSELGFSVNAPMITVWGAIESLCRDGYRELNLGGVPASASNQSDIAHGLYRFKRSFGGVETTCRSFEKETPGLRSTLFKILNK